MFKIITRNNLFFSFENIVLIKIVIFWPKMYEQNDLINSLKFFFNIKKVSTTFGVLSQ